MWAGVGRHDLALPLALEAGGAGDAAVELMAITVAYVAMAVALFVLARLWLPLGHFRINLARSPSL